MESFFSQLRFWLPCPSMEGNLSLRYNGLTITLWKNAGLQFEMLFGDSLVVFMLFRAFK